MFWLIAVAPATARPPMPKWLGVRSSEIWIVGHEVVVSAKPMLVAGRYIIMSRFPIVKLADKFIGSAAVYRADPFSVHIECHILSFHFVLIVENLLPCTPFGFEVVGKFLPKFFHLGNLVGDVARPKVLFALIAVAEKIFAVMLKS